MNFEDMPILRIDIEQMSRSILSHLGVLSSELGDALEKEIEKAVESFPWEKRVQELTHVTIQTELESFFKYGQGHDAIVSSIQEGFEKQWKSSNDKI